MTKVASGLFTIHKRGVYGRHGNSYINKTIRNHRQSRKQENALQGLAVVVLWKSVGTSIGKEFSHLPQNIYTRNLRKYVNVLIENLRKYANVFSENLRKYAIVLIENLRKYAIVRKEKALQRLSEYRSPCKAWHYLPLKCNFLTSPPEPCR